jgi:hypothetical protein
LELVKTQAIGTGVSTVTVSDAFSSKYDNYKIIVSGGSASNDGYLALSFSGSSTGYSMFMTYAAFNTNTNIGAGISNSSSWVYSGSTQTSQYAALNAELINPFLPRFTRMTASPVAITATETGISTGIHAVATSYTGFNVFTTAGTLTGGTVYVYGYRKA